VISYGMAESAFQRMKRHVDSCPRCKVACETGQETDAMCRLGRMLFDTWERSESAYAEQHQ
jgi:hypothetical protein